MWSLHFKTGCYSEAEEGKYFSMYLAWPFYIHTNEKEIWLQTCVIAELPFMSQINQIMKFKRGKYLEDN